VFSLSFANCSSMDPSYGISLLKSFNTFCVNGHSIAVSLTKMVLEKGEKSPCELHTRHTNPSCAGAFFHSDLNHSFGSTFLG
jgi:hypothetical protein